MRWKPGREVEIVAGTPPGGGLDRTARALAKALDAAGLIGHPARVVNVAGDGGRKAWDYLDGKRGDAHVLSISHSNLATDEARGASRFRHQADFTPLAILCTEYIAFVTLAGSGIAGAAEFLRRLRTAPGTVTVALSTALGNPNHIALAKVVLHAGGDPRAPRVRVFDSALDAVADVLAGHAEVAAVTAASPVPQLDAGTMRAFAVSAPRRLGGCYAGTPVWAELGVDCIVGAWRGASGPRGLQPDEIAFWERALATAVATREWQSELTRYYWTDAYLDGPALRAYLDREAADMSVVLHELGLLKDGDP